MRAAEQLADVIARWCRRLRQLLCLHRWTYGAVSLTRGRRCDTTPARICPRCRQQQRWNPAQGWVDR